ncbi:hypothetical protein LQ564_00945 [Massilia sp. G4R7]|uniref:Uncharacterized protein n=1 Tax=Massilia phyllostachyos TaxID=2898585 RepID=A0ABS8Q1K4_9BURK|nr:hypothetical protein [Massilia phyllostachyos]MCD2514876.1 hypothetical protein [Massilia phyllostachyos]
MNKLAFLFPLALLAACGSTNSYLAQKNTTVEMYQILASRLVGTPEEWITKTIRDMVRSIETAAQARSRYVEGQPKLGPEPAIAQLDS